MHPTEFVMEALRVLQREAGLSEIVSVMAGASEEANKLRQLARAAVALRCKLLRGEYLLLTAKSPPQPAEPAADASGGLFMLEEWQTVEADHSTKIVDEQGSVICDFLSSEFSLADQKAIARHLVELHNERVRPAGPAHRGEETTC